MEETELEREGRRKIRGRAEGDKVRGRADKVGGRAEG